MLNLPMMDWRLHVNHRSLRQTLSPYRAWLDAPLGIIVFFTFRHYGVSWDEEIQNQYGQAVFDYYASGFTDKHYNQIFNLSIFTAACLMVWRPSSTTYADADL